MRDSTGTSMDDATLHAERVAVYGAAKTLLASGARGATAGTNATAVTGLDAIKRLLVLLDVTAAAAENTDTLDVYIDVLGPDAATYLNAIHFTQMLGNGGAKKFFAVLDPSAPGALDIDVTADAAAGAVRPALFGSAVRVRYVIADAGGAAASFTFSVTAFAQG
jgi:hypothetical protein